MKPWLLGLIFVSSVASAQNFMSAAEARKQIEMGLCIHHEEACQWWTNYIQHQILEQVQHQNCVLTVDVTVASYEVQAYLESALERNGYHTEVIPGWSTDHLSFEERSKNRKACENDEKTCDHGHPDGKTYLGISW